jgi:hypothetical protein
MLLKGAQELQLQGRCDVADLIEEDRSAVRRLEEADVVARGAGERPDC